WAAWSAYRSPSSGFAAEVPHDADDDQASTGEHIEVERLGVEPPAHDCDQRDSQKIERDGEACVSRPKSVAHAIVGQQAGNSEAEHARQQVETELAHEGRAGADSQRKLDHVHPEHD